MYITKIDLLAKILCRIVNDDDVYKIHIATFGPVYQRVSGISTAVKSLFSFEFYISKVLRQLFVLFCLFSISCF